MKRKKAASRAAGGNASLPTSTMNLLYQALETEMGGVEVYTTALECVENGELRKEWTSYLVQTRRHVEILRDVCTKIGLDPDRDTPGRQVVRHIGKSLVKAMQMALGSGEPEAAEIAAAECVALAETKDHGNWALIGKLAEGFQAKGHAALRAAAEEVEEEEDEHLYHTQGWARELWLKSLELPAQIPPPEEQEDVHSAEEAAASRRQSVRALRR